MASISLPQNIIIGFEGMPGAGKTSTLFELIKSYPHCILLSETNPEPGMGWETFSDSQKSDYFHTNWVERMDLITHRYDASQITFFLDRTFYSNLAFKYAFDKLTGSTSYKDYLEKYNEDFSKYEVSIMFILDVEPSIGLKRRQKIDKNIPFPWGEPKFLQAFREFYQYELPKITNTKLIYINTDTLSSIDLQKNIQSILKESYNFIPERNLQKSEVSADLQAALDFALEKQLEGPSSRVINVFGVPTVYFQRHSVQVIHNKPVLFNNRQLKYLLNNTQVEH